MSGSTAPGRVFVVGVARSGTTLLQSLLAAHSRVTSFTESHFFSRHYRFLWRTSVPFLATDPRARLREFLLENGLHGSALPDASFLATGPGDVGRLELLLRSRAAARDFIETLDRAAAARGAQHWVEKTPMHLRYVAFIDAISRPTGGCSFVHLIREGIDVVASLRKASRSWERAYDVRECAERWNDDLARSLARVESERDHLVFYEELAARPEETMKALLPRIGLDWEPSILEGYGRAAAAVVTDAESWKADIDRRIAPSRAAADSLTAAELAEARAVLRPELWERLRSAAADRARRPPVS